MSVWDDYMGIVRPDDCRTPQRIAEDQAKAWWFFHAPRPRRRSRLPAPGGAS